MEMLKKGKCLFYAWKAGESRTREKEEGGKKNDLWFIRRKIPTS